MDEKVNKLCSLVDDWEYWESRDISPEAMEFIKKEKFFGMIIPEDFGGLGFSALAHSEVVCKVSNPLNPTGCFYYGTKLIGAGRITSSLRNS